MIANAANALLAKERLGITTTRVSLKETSVEILKQQLLKKKLLCRIV